MIDRVIDCAAHIALAWKHARYAVAARDFRSFTDRERTRWEEAYKTEVDDVKRHATAAVNCLVYGRAEG